MKKLISLILYLAYVAVLWAKQLILPHLTELAKVTFNLRPLLILSIVVPVICTVIIILRTHLAERSFTPRNLLFYGAFIAATVFMVGWSIYDRHDIGAHLLALFTQTVCDFVMLFFYRKSE